MLIICELACVKLSYENLMNCVLNLIKGPNRVKCKSCMLIIKSAYLLCASAFTAADYAKLVAAKTANLITFSDELFAAFVFASIANSRGNRALLRP